jgi:hypothetical protein
MSSSAAPDAAPMGPLRATVTNQDGAVILEGECWVYTMRPA